MFLYYNKPEQAIELHSNKKKVKEIIEKINEKPEILQKIRILGQNRILDKICPGKFLHPETPHNM